MPVALQGVTAEDGFKNRLHRSSGSEVCAERQGRGRGLTGAKGDAGFGLGQARRQGERDGLGLSVAKRAGLSGAAGGKAVRFGAPESARTAWKLNGCLLPAGPKIRSLSSPLQFWKARKTSALQGHARCSESLREKGVEDLQDVEANRGAALQKTQQARLSTRSSRRNQQHGQFRQVAADLQRSAAARLVLQMKLGKSVDRQGRFDTQAPTHPARVIFAWDWMRRMGSAERRPLRILLALREIASTYLASPLHPLTFDPRPLTPDPQPAPSTSVFRAARPLPLSKIEPAPKDTKTGPTLPAHPCQQG
ncbi:hypothetical protein L1887_48571 [Cichorium endivia]|nr:hypothetical protein L1887_48571 [Cichorium endivia]